MPEEVKVNESWVEYRRLVLQQLEEGHAAREKLWAQIRKLEIDAANDNIRLDRIERAERIKLWVVRVLFTGVLLLILKDIFTSFQG